MFNSQEIKQVQEITKKLFEKITVPVEIEIKPFKEQTLPVEIKTDEPQILIGEKGQTLSEIQHLLKAILRKIIDKPFYIDLDINGYKRKKIDYLKQLARSSADEVVLNGQEKVLTPMSAYERRIVHLELAERGNITTESIGEEPERKIAIRPYP